MPNRICIDTNKDQETKTKLIRVKTYDDIIFFKLIESSLTRGHIESLVKKNYVGYMIILTKVENWMDKII